MREECRHCLYQTPFSGCVHPYGWVYDYEYEDDDPVICPYREEEHRWRISV